MTAVRELQGRRAVKRWRGTAENFAKEVPQNAEELQATYLQSRIETFVTSGKPTTDTLKPTGVGLELAPVTHPNDLVAGKTATFQLLLDGKPAANVKIRWCRAATAIATSSAR